MTTPFDKTNICLLDSASGAQNHRFALFLGMRIVIIIYRNVER
jgi:hypothetical protein